VALPGKGFVSYAAPRRKAVEADCSGHGAMRDCRQFREGIGSAGDGRADGLRGSLLGEPRPAAVMPLAAAAADSRPLCADCLPARLWPRAIDAAEKGGGAVGFSDLSLATCGGGVSGSTPRRRRVSSQGGSGGGGGCYRRG